MRTLETQRLTLRKFTPEDFAAVHQYAAFPENVVYMPWGPNTEEQTRDFIGRAIEDAEKSPCANYQFAAVLKESGRLIGGCNLSLASDFSEGEIGWILHRNYWKRGFGVELGKELLRFAFEDLGLQRVTARCDSENYGSYRVMEKIGLRREGLFLQCRPAHKQSEREYGDEFSYAILREEWDVRNEIEACNALPVRFDDFIDVPALSDGEIFLVCTDKKPAIPEKKYVPSYTFAICREGEKIGEIGLRVGYTDGLYYGGQIGYGVDEKVRGRGYAGAACRLLLPVAKAHGMKKLLITNNYTNTASRRVCEKLGAKLLRMTKLPEWHELYKEGQRFSNIFEWSVE